MTYREKIQEFATQIWELYEKAGSMRDHSFDQNAFNRVRSYLYNAALELGNHDNRLTTGEAASNWE